MAKLQKQSVGFTQVANQVLCDKNLSAKAKWIYAYLYSKPDDWQFAYNRIASEFSDGEKSILSGLKELEKFWYLERKKQGDGSVDYFLYIEPTAENRHLDTDPTAEKGKLPFGQVAEIGSINNIDNTTNTEIYTNTNISSDEEILCDEKNSENFSLNPFSENSKNPLELEMEVSKSSADRENLTKPKVGQTEKSVSNSRNLENEARAKMLQFLKQSVGCDKFKDYNEWTEVGKILRIAEKLGKEQFVYRLETILEDPFKAKNSNKLAYLRKEIEAFIHSPAITSNSEKSWIIL